MDDRPGRWEDRRALAALLRAGIVVAPLVVAAVTVRVADVVFAPRAWTMVQELLLMVPLALAAGWATQRALRRFLPLAMLLRMAVLFPGQAPSRYAVARQARSRDQLMTLLENRDCGPQHAARAMMTLLAALAGHDRHTRGHSERTRVLADVLGAELDLSQHDRDRLRWAALLHDVGKLEIARSILTKPGGLNEPEWQRMRLHPVHGAELTSALTGWLGPWAAGILHHHERFDGSGYPAGLSGEQISQAGRVIAVVDAYETMTASRTYQRPRSTRQAREELVRCAGTHFDPLVVRAFLSVSLPRLLWATGPVALLTHLPFMRDLQLVGQQVAAASGASAATAAGVTAMAISASAVPAWTQPAEPVGGAGTVVEQRAEQGSGAAVGASPEPSGTSSSGPTSTPTSTPGAAAGPAATTPAGPTTVDGRDGGRDGRGAQDGKSAGKGAQGEAAQNKAAQDEAAQEKAAKDKAAQDKAAQDKAAQDKAAQDKAAQDKAAQDKAARDKAAQEKAAQDKAAQDKAAQDKAAKEKAAQEKAAQDKAAKDKAAKDEAAQDNAARDKAARDKSAQERAAQDETDDRDDGGDDDG